MKWARPLCSCFQNVSVVQCKNKEFFLLSERIYMLSLCLAFLFPRRCPICHHILKHQQSLICPDCYKKVVFVHEPSCFCCGKPLEKEEKEFCGDCRKHPKSFRKGMALCVYNDEVKDSLAAIKYQNQKEYIQFYIAEIKKRKLKQLEDLKIDLILPVPLHKRKKRQRGFNQAMLFAQGIGELLHKPASGCVLIRTKYTKPLKSLNPQERLDSMEHSFWSSDEVKGKRILLVDDIYTTGATAESCTRALKSAGAEGVWVFCVAIGYGI